MSYLKSETSNLSNCKILQINAIKNKYKKWDKKCLIQRLLSYKFKKICSIVNEHSRTCPIVKFSKKVKIPKFGTTSSLFQYQISMSIEFQIKFIEFQIKFGQNFEKTCIACSEVSTLKFVQNFAKIQKCLILRQRMPCLGIYELEFF